MKCKLRMKLSSANTANNVIVTVVPSASSSPPTNQYTARTQPFAKTAYFNASKPNEGCLKNGWFEYSLTPQRFLGKTRIQFEADTYEFEGQYNAGPAALILWYIYLTVQDFDVTATTASVLQVRLDWEVELSQWATAAAPVTLVLPEEKKEVEPFVQVDQPTVAGLSRFLNF